MIIFSWKDMATDGCRAKGSSYKEDRFNGRMSFQTDGRLGLLEERLANLQKGRHESLYQKAGFMIRYGQLERSAKGDLTLRPRLE